MPVPPTFGVVIYLISRLAPEAMAHKVERICKRAVKKSGIGNWYEELSLFVNASHAEASDSMEITGEGSNGEG